MLPSLAPHWASLGLPVAHWAGAGPFPERAECGWLGGPSTCPASAVSAMETGRVMGAGALLVALVVLGAHAAGGEESSGIFLAMGESECQYLNGTERVRYVERFIYNREQYVHFDSDVGLYVADTPLGEPTAKHWNSQPEKLEDTQTAVDTFCRHNYQIEVKWFQNGREEMERVVSTDVIPNGDWTYQVLVMLETTPQRGDTYTCQVEHVSLQHPVSQCWELQLDGARSKMLTGVGGFVLGLIFLVLGLGLYVRKKGAPFPRLQGS
ncbi:class II histocompatibility antigen, B-L beta chain-like isoform X6 [Strix aluco]|uniref:class II histocompatibility antigen, B-L beta chain-like isoform X6 n=1 Tax=Strix aluco TaxID=111821 RepID=UPI003DA3E37D